jgi:hypothetical protein
LLLKKILISLFNIFFINHFIFNESKLFEILPSSKRRLKLPAAVTHLNTTYSGKVDGLTMPLFALVVIEQHLLDINAEKQLPQAAIDVLLTQVL